MSPTLTWWRMCRKSSSLRCVLVSTINLTHLSVEKKVRHKKYLYTWYTMSNEIHIILILCFFFFSCWARLQPPSPGGGFKVHAVGLGRLYGRVFWIQGADDPHDDRQQAAGAVRGPDPDLGGGQRPFSRHRVPDQFVCPAGSDAQRAHHHHAEDAAS